MAQLSRLPPRSVLLSFRSEVATGNPLPPEGAHTVSLIFAVSRLCFCLPLEGGGTAKP